MSKSTIRRPSVLFMVSWRRQGRSWRRQVVRRRSCRESYRPCASRWKRLGPTPLWNSKRCSHSLTPMLNIMALGLKTALNRSRPPSQSWIYPRLPWMILCHQHLLATLLLVRVTTLLSQTFLPRMMGSSLLNLLQISCHHFQPIHWARRYGEPSYSR